MQKIWGGLAAVLSLGLVMAAIIQTNAQPPTSMAAQAEVGRVAVDVNDIGGIVSSSKGPEAGVWVIAETSDLPTKLRKIVVTDDRGRYLLPGLPKANYKIWVRGYGLVDSRPVEANPGQTLALTAVVAPDAAAAAQYYPANYWYSLLEIPKKEDFPGTGDPGNGISPKIKNQGQWRDVVKTDVCETCHQLGNKYTRTIPAAFSNLDPAQAWQRRVQSGEAGPLMIESLTRLWL